MRVTVSLTGELDASGGSTAPEEPLGGRGRALMEPLVAGCTLSPTASSGTPIPAGPTPTPTPTVIYENPFTTTAISWSSGQHCFIGAGGYHITGGFLCRGPAGDLTDADITVQVEQISGPTTFGYGIAFRRPSVGNHYDIDIDSNSKWVLVKCVGDTCKRVIDYTPNAAIVGGLNTVNTLRVRGRRALRLLRQWDQGRPGGRCHLHHRRGRPYR